MKEFLEYLLKNIVTKPDEVTVSEVQEEGMVIYKVSASNEDMGIIIGKEGKNIRSIRNLVKSKAIKDNVRVNVQVEEPQTEKNAALPVQA